MVIGIPKKYCMEKARFRNTETVRKMIADGFEVLGKGAGTESHFSMRITLPEPK